MEDKVCIRIEADYEQIERCSNLINEISTKVSSTSSLLEIVANQTRLNILLLLHTEGRLCVCDLSDILNLSVSAISQHLRKMRDRDFIFSKKEAQTIYYSLADTHKPFLDQIIRQVQLNNILTDHENK